ncbi:MAG: ABC transporter ATP-binding protein [Halanaeroarchaeum sp.]
MSTNQSEPMLRIDDLRVSYGMVQALKSIDLSVNHGELVSVIGPNGAGKSTLAETLSGFQDYDGSIRFEDEEISSLSDEAIVRNGLIHCTESRDLFGHMSVQDNLELGGFQNQETTEEQLEFVFDLFPILEERLDQDAQTMSGGQQQMLAIGRALVGDPELLVLDEPTLGLAPVIIDDIADALQTLQERDITILLLEQNVQLALRHSDRIYLLENGEIELEGTPDELEAHEYIREAFIGQ